MGNRQVNVLIVTVFAGAVIAFYAGGGARLLDLDFVQAHREQLLAYSQQHYWIALLLAGIAYATIVALSIPGALLMSLLTGMLFGRWVGGSVIVVSATLGSTLVFLAARHLFGEAAQRRLDRSPVAHGLLRGFEEDATSYLLFLRLVPLFPLWLVNLALACTPVRTRTYVAATLIGIMPGSFVNANLGQSLGRVESMEQLWSAETLIAFALLALVSVIPVWVRRTRSAVRDAEVRS